MSAAAFAGQGGFQSQGYSKQHSYIDIRNEKEQISFLKKKSIIYLANPHIFDISLNFPCVTWVYIDIISLYISYKYTDMLNGRKNLHNFFIFGEGALGFFLA